jgi:alcohol dehydrogenase class IV
VTKTSEQLSGTPFRFLAQADMTAGNGLFRQLPASLKDRGFQSPTFLVDEGFSKSPLWNEVKRVVDETFGAAASYHIIPGVAEPTYNSLRATVGQVRQTEQDILIGVGGGSCMDTTKAVAALLTNPGDPLDYRGFDKLKNPGVPVMLVPTTAGTGSEAAYNASFVDEASNRKMGVNGRFMFPTYALLDGETTLSCPYPAALSAGLDALVHSLEGFVCKQRNPMTDMLAKRAFPLLVNALPSLKTDPTNVDRRLDLLLGAYLGGMIQMNSGSGVAAAISYPLSVFHKVPHGIGGALFCVDVVKFNIDNGFYLYAELAPLIGVGRPGASDKENATAVLEHLQQLWATLGVPKSLSAFGIGHDQFDDVLKTMATQQPGFDQNPIPFTVTGDLPRLLSPFFAAKT